MTRTHVTVQLSGGLGNQLFQYAAARSLAIDNEADLLLDVSFYDAGRHRRFELESFNIQGNIVGASSDPRWLRQLKTVGTRLWRFDGPSYLEPHYHFDPHLSEARLPVKIKGYFQSARYFEHHSQAIQQELTPPIPEDEESQQLGEILDAVNSISLHVRRGDYVTNPKASKTFHECSPDYYRQALNRLPDSGPVVVFSDDIEWAESHLPRTRELIFAGTAGPRFGLADMWLMGRAQHHVIANSSFSWWGAWLSQRTDGHTVAPLNWFRDPGRNCSDLIPDNWTRV